MPWPFSRRSSAIAGSTVESSSSPQTRFAFRLFRELARGQKENIFFSPTSVMLCLAMVHELASGETRSSIANALEIGDSDRAELESQIATLKSAFRSRTDAQVLLGNALFLGVHAQVNSALQSQLRSLYDAELSAVDFSSLGTVATINEWVSTKTNGKIHEVVSQLSPVSALVAVNAVYFKSRWLKPFLAEFTRDRPFRTASGTIKPVPMMVQGGRYSYYEDKTVQVALLPYLGDVSMCVVLPAADSDLTKLRHNLNSGLWESWIAGARSMQGTIQLPRFRVDYGSEMSHALSALGMERAFDQQRAEFHHVHTDRPPVWLDRVAHRAVAEVNEHGTEVAAATVAYLEAAAMPMKPVKRFLMIVDRPFLFLIRDNKTETIMFLGWIGDPQMILS